MTPLAAKPRFRVALQGFSEFERSALASYFRLAGDRFPAYEQTGSLDEAAFVVADADDPAAVERVALAARVPDTVFIGAQAPEGALAWMMRPIDPMHVLRELDAAIAMRQAGAAGAAGASRELGSAPLPTRRASDLPEPARNVPPEALVVDGDDLAARALERQLASLGLSVARANGSAKALELVERLPFRFVFIDVDLGEQSELDGLNLCQRLKRGGRAAGQPGPAVFLLTSRDLAVDRVRAALAGGDAFLNKPLDESTLRRLLAQHGARFPRHGGPRSVAV